MLAHPGIIEGARDMVMWKLKSCPRCRGDIAIERELDGWYEQCLQCGYLRDLARITKVYQRSGNEEKEELSRMHSQYPVEAEMNPCAVVGSKG